MNRYKQILISILVLLFFLVGFFMLQQEESRYKVLLVNTNLYEEDLSGYDFLKEKIAQTIPDAEIELVHYEKFTEDLLDTFKPTAIILGGQGTPWSEYPRDKLEAAFITIRNTKKPLLGICGGHQLIALAYGSEVSPIQVIDASKPGYEGCWREEGWVQVKALALKDPLLKDLETKMTVYMNHCDEVKDIPPGFIQLIEGLDCKIQAFRHKKWPIYGIQFHPEVFDENYPDGKTIFYNFFYTVAD